MEKITLEVKGMSCGHCVNAVKNALATLPCIDSVNVDLDTAVVTMEYDPTQVSLDAIKATIEDQGFEVKHCVC